MTIIPQNIQQLKEIKTLLTQLPADLYTKPNEILSQATLGQHFRHILEFYLCIEKSVNKGSVCYDDRERDIRIETSVAYAIETIDHLIGAFAQFKEDHTLTMLANYSSTLGERTVIRSSLFRELAYALDHTIHHLAIIKIALNNSQIEVDENFGVAPSTVRYRSSLVK